MSVRRFRWLGSSPCNCHSWTWQTPQGDKAALEVCCAGCYEQGMRSIEAEVSRQNAELDQLQLEMDIVMEAATPPPAELFPR